MNIFTTHNSHRIKMNGIVKQVKIIKHGRFFHRVSDTFTSSKISDIFHTDDHFIQLHDSSDYCIQSVLTAQGVLPRSMNPYIC